MFHVEHPLTDEEVRFIQGLKATPSWRAVQKYLHWRANLAVTALNLGDYSDRPWTAGQLVRERSVYQEIAELPSYLKTNPTGDSDEGRT